MEEFYLEYFIENRYASPVRKANFQLLVIPESSPFQTVQEIKFSSGSEQEMHISKNVFGFETINYYINKPFPEFWFKLSAKILKPEINPFYVSPLLPENEFDLINSIDFQIDNFLFLRSTDLTKMPFENELQFPVYSAKTMILDYLSELNSYIYESFEYSPESTDVNTPIEDVLKIRKGVCQDFAHLFISVCRLNKIAARYVSGYLNQGAGFVGSSQTHAWAEVFIPEIGWIGFDSTNNLLADHHYIKIAHGTDYRDCSPIIGVLETTGEQESKHSVFVTNQ
jgi:transglutaminase-like putative cysteine protease